MTETNAQKLAYVLFQLLEERSGDYTKKQLDAFTEGWAAAWKDADCDITNIHHKPEQEAYLSGYLTANNIIEGIS